MKNNNLLKSLLCLALLLAVMVGGVLGVNAFASPIVEANRKALLGDNLVLFDRTDPDSAEITVTADSVQSVLRDDSKQIYTLKLSSSKGYTKDPPIEMTLVVDFEGKIVSLDVDAPGETKNDDLAAAGFLPSFVGQDSTLAGVEQVAGVTRSSSAIRNAVNDGFNTLIDNGRFAAAEKSDEQLLRELVPVAYSGIVNKDGVIQGEALEPSGSVTEGYLAANGGGCLFLTEKDGEKLLAVYTQVGGLSVYRPEGEDITASADPALLEELQTLADAALGEADTAMPKSLKRLLPDDAQEPVPVQIPGLHNYVVQAWTVESGEGSLCAFAAKPYGYGNAVMDVYYVLDESGAIYAMRVKSIFIEEEFFPNVPELDMSAYRESFTGLTVQDYSGGVSQITGATASSEAMESATTSVFEAFALLTENRG